jgi:hypothetical protein
MPAWTNATSAGGGYGGGGGGALDFLSGGLGGLASSAIGGVFNSIFNRGKAKREAENARLMQQHGIDTKNKSRKRKASTVGSLLRKLQEHPEVYGKYFSADMFGELPGALTADDLLDPNAPKYKAQSGLSALIQGAGEGVGGYMGDRNAAQYDVEGRILDRARG